MEPAGKGEREAEGADQGASLRPGKTRSPVPQPLAPPCGAGRYRGASSQARAPVHHQVTLSPACAGARPSPRTEAGAALILRRKSHRARRRPGREAVPRPCHQVPTRRSQDAGSSPTTGPTDRKTLHFSTVFLLRANTGSWAQKAVSSAQKKSKASDSPSPASAHRRRRSPVRDQGHLWDGGLQPRSVGWGLEQDLLQTGCRVGTVWQ